ncbi:unnamed protein product [Didymodactylos carnosus]|uniref:Uncharacterized protein n=1 Tax=Didymodactylos carnosus TaxID=1234261 RepID=A0A8S2HBY8_9BILA|nr:unnamed protein product [Didymodactylos carnosus]CAF3626555.1 unnamed protein product [Didymodactylos carnosus]
MLPSVRRIDLDKLQSMLETKPPISKAKMMSITKAAIKSIKFYKHVVMNVEKFIAKCKPEYKIPGLYVIDSVIRQSRHQYGLEKDVYGARFAKNIVTTVQNIHKCPSEEKVRVMHNKITRVLNLWQKNSIFGPDLLRQLFEIHNNGVVTDLKPDLLALFDDKKSDKASFDSSGSSSNHQLNRFQELRETLIRAQAKGDTDTTSILTEIQQITNQLLESQKKSDGSINNNNTSAISAASTTKSETMPSLVGSVLDDFDYGSDEDDEQLLAGKAIARQQASQSFSQPPTTSLGQVSNMQPPSNQLHFATSSSDQRYLQPPVLYNNNSSSFSGANVLFPMSFDPSRPPPVFYQNAQQTLLPSTQQYPQQQNLQQQHDYSHHTSHRRPSHEPNDVDLRPEDMDADSFDESPQPPRTNDRHYPRGHRRSRSRSGSRDRKRQRSSSGSANKRDAAASRLKETERKERRRKGLPPLKEDHLVVSSRTLWLGHLPKMITEMDLRETLEPHGEINDINNIPPRGCAFVCFKERQDAARCLEKMKDFKFQGNPIKIAWATNKGVKDRFKDYWDVEHGCTYIPYNELKDVISTTSLESLAEGGVIDDESIPAFLKSPSMPSAASTNKTILHTPQPGLLPPPPPSFPDQVLVAHTPPNILIPNAHFDTPGGRSQQQQQQRDLSAEIQATQNGQLSHQHPSLLQAPSTASIVRTSLPGQLQQQQQEIPLMSQSGFQAGVPVQMLPHLIQVQSMSGHPQLQQVQLVQRIAGTVLPNGQIIRQVPFGHMVSQQGLQLHHSAADIKELNSQGIAGGPTLIQLQPSGATGHQTSLIRTTQQDSNDFLSNMTMPSVINRQSPRSNQIPSDDEQQSQQRTAFTLTRHDQSVIENQGDNIGFNSEEIASQMRISPINLVQHQQRPTMFHHQHPHQTHNGPRFQSSTQFIATVGGQPLIANQARGGPILIRTQDGQSILPSSNSPSTPQKQQNPFARGALLPTPPNVSESENLLHDTPPSGRYHTDRFDQQQDDNTSIEKDDEDNRSSYRGRGGPRRPFYNRGGPMTRGNRGNRGGYDRQDSGGRGQYHRGDFRTGRGGAHETMRGRTAGGGGGRYRGGNMPSRFSENTDRRRPRSPSSSGQHYNRGNERLRDDMRNDDYHRRGGQHRYTQQSQQFNFSERESRRLPEEALRPDKPQFETRNDYRSNRSIDDLTTTHNNNKLDTSSSIPSDIIINSDDNKKSKNEGIAGEN